MEIWTDLGEIAVYRKDFASERTPLILLHGVYFDHHLWDHQVQGIHDRKVYTLDMPLHGKSTLISKVDWSLEDCADMLLQILDKLEIHRVIAVGHSWGSMTILRAAHKRPERFESVLLCNMPFRAATMRQKWIFGMQHALLLFRGFYIRQAAGALFARSSLRETPLLAEELRRTMGQLSAREIETVDRRVILEADDATEMIRGLQFEALALLGREDYVPAPPNLPTVLVKGGHVSPLEAPQEVLRVIRKLLGLEAEGGLP